jgi:TRAP-type mannitol/chloroaromatic compound transport system permease large subunit
LELTIFTPVYAVEYEFAAFSLKPHKVCIAVKVLLSPMERVFNPPSILSFSLLLHCSLQQCFTSISFGIAGYYVAKITQTY